MANFFVGMAEPEYCMLKQCWDARCPVDLGRHICEVCGNEKARSGKALLVCTGCQLVRYRSEEHQKEDWPLHQWPCRRVPKISQEDNETRTMHKDRIET